MRCFITNQQCNSTIHQYKNLSPKQEALRQILVKYLIKDLSSKKAGGSQALTTALTREDFLNAWEKILQKGNETDQQKNINVNVYVQNIQAQANAFFQPPVAAAPPPPPEATSRSTDQSSSDKRSKNERHACCTIS